MEVSFLTLIMINHLCGRWPLQKSLFALECWCSLVCFAPRGRESLKDKGICFLKGWGWGKAGLPLPPPTTPPTNITFYSEGGEGVVCGLERRGEGTWPTVQTVFMSPLTVRVCHRPSQWQPLFVCGRKHGHFFLLEVSCLVRGRLALPAVGGRFVFFFFVACFFFASFPPHYWHLYSHLKARNFTLHLKKQCFGNCPLSSSMGCLFPGLFVIHSVETIK